MRNLITAALVALAPAAAWGQAFSAGQAEPRSMSGQARVPPVASAVRAESAPRVDGRLDDDAWADAPAIRTFTQRDPHEGEAASEATEVRIVYDDQAIYVGARLHDRSPVTSRLGRRDMPLSASDWLRVSFDSYHDRRTAFRFDINPAGVRRDATLGVVGGFFGRGGGFTGLEGDLAWDPVWDAAATTDGGGWTAEMRIPFSQLRFAPAEEQVWGLQIERVIDRTQELALFSFTSRSEPGGIPAFGDLHGLRGIRPGRPLELIPYVLGESRLSPAGANPFVEQREVQANAGLDARYRITSNLTLSATVNPDFGQVEVDPAIINLTAFETRLEEKRPFFVEGASSFKFGGNIIGPGGNAANLLYSRRVGRAPQVGIAAEQVDLPGVTDILGAAKLSGKTADGWSIGVLDAVTSRESRRYLDAGGEQGEALVEPLTNYFAGRLNRELRRGQSAVGGILTAVTRDLGDAGAAAALRSDAYAGGVDFVHEWANREWALGGFVVGSHLRGSERAMLLTQRSSTRYYQRPDSEALQADPAATSLGGYAATLQLRKPSGVHWTGDLWVGTISPGFEINDLGFQQRADRTGTGGMVQYHQRQPGAVLRNWSVNASQNFARNWDGDFIEKIVRAGASLTHLNYWELDVGATYEFERLDDRLTRGGPLALRPATWTARAEVGSDPRKSLTGNVALNLLGDEAGGWVRTLQTTLDVQTSPEWNLSVGPRLQSVRQHAQYVATVADATQLSTFGARYVFAPLRQSELSLVTRLNWTFSPDLSFELYAQPLVANGDYGTPREFRTPSAYDFAEYGTEVGTLARDGRRYVVDPDGAGPAGPFRVPDRSFTTRSLRGNAVLRWEYRPGSTLYLVWQQERLNADLMADFGTHRALGTLLDAPASNVLVVKWSYWMNP